MKSSKVCFGTLGTMVPKVPKHTLEDFIAEKMSMSHIYQPAMLKVLLEKV